MYLILSIFMIWGSTKFIACKKLFCKVQKRLPENCIHIATIHQGFISQILTNIRFSLATINDREIMVTKLPQSLCKKTTNIYFV